MTMLLTGGTDANGSRLSQADIRAETELTPADQSAIRKQIGSDIPYNVRRITPRLGAYRKPSPA